MTPKLMVHAPALNPAWTPKAMAFVTRSHRHLWGKNSEGPQAFLFSQGLNNRFIKDLLLGWNKFGQERPAQNWGLTTDAGPTQKIFLPSGIVVPYIVDRALRSVFIQAWEQGNKTLFLPGSADPTMVLGKAPEKIALVRDLMDGLFLFQEIKDQWCVMVHPCPDIPLAAHCRSMLMLAREARILVSKKQGIPESSQGFPGLDLHYPDPHSFYTYGSKQELIDCCLMH
jgi:hypothetical protein